MKSTQDTISATVWDSYEDYLDAKKASFECFEQRRLSPSRLSVSVTQQKLAFSDDATPDLNIQVLLQGGVDIAKCDMGYGSTSFSCQAGAFLVVPAFAELALDGQGEFELATASVPWANVAHDLELSTGRKTEDFGVLHSGVQRDQLTVELMRYLLNTEFESEVAADSVFCMIIARLLRLSGEDDTLLSKRRTLSASVLSRLIEFIHANIETGVALESLAQIAGCSRYHFCRAFKAATGFTPNEYLIRLRVENAKERIRRGEPLADIALRSGFSDQSHMTRLFKRIYGTTPGRFQSQVSPLPAGGDMRIV